jgi:hypothetical protein
VEVNEQYRLLLQQLSPDTYKDMSGCSTFVTITLEDMEFDGLVEPEEPGSLNYRLTPKGVEARQASASGS